MYFFILIIFSSILLGYLSYRINVLNKGAQEFLPRFPKYLFKIIIYLGTLGLLYLSKGNSFYNLLTLFLIFNILAYDLSKEFRENYSRIIESIPSVLIKITSILISILVITEINTFATTTIGLSISNFSIVLTFVTFLFASAYFGNIILLVIAFLIEIKLFVLLFKTERVSSRMRIFLYNLLTDNNKVKINTPNDKKLKKPLNALMLVLQLMLTLYILLSTDFIDKPKKILERIVIAVAYSDIYRGCNNITAQPFSKMMFIDLENVSLATPVWESSISITERTEQNIERYEFSQTTCHKENDIR